MSGLSGATINAGAKMELYEIASSAACKTLIHAECAEAPVAIVSVADFDASELTDASTTADGDPVAAGRAE